MQEFNLEIRHKKGIEKVVVDYLSHLESLKSNPIEEINEAFPCKMLYLIITTPWYVDYVNYLARSIIPLEYLSYQKKNSFVTRNTTFWTIHFFRLDYPSLCAKGRLTSSFGIMPLYTI